MKIRSIFPVIGKGGPISYENRLPDEVVPLEDTKAVILEDLAQEIHDWARSKGFYDREILKAGPMHPDYRGRDYIENPSLASEKVALMGEELGELVKALRKGDKQNEAEEVADLVIRALDFCAWRGIALTDEIEKKMLTNMNRPYLHGADRVF